MPRELTILGVCLALLTAPAFTGFAAAQKDNKDNKKGKSPAVISPEREAAVLTFVRRNHDELELLLSHLRKARPREYEKAIRELFRATDRLAQIHDRDPEQYELELRLWKIQSRLQLLSAKVQMGPQDDFKQQIKDSLKEQLEVKAAMLERQQKRLAEQSRKVEEDLKRLKSDEESWIARQYEILTKPPTDGTPTEDPNTAVETTSTTTEAAAVPPAPPVRKPEVKNKPAKK